MLLTCTFAAAKKTATYDVHDKLYVDGHPAANAQLVVAPCNEPKAAVTVKTEADGSFALNDFAQGVYCVKTDLPAVTGAVTLRVDDSTKDGRIDLTDTYAHPGLTDGFLIAIFCIASVLLVLYPIWRFLRKTWVFRRDLLIGQLAGEPLELYYQQFRRGSKTINKISLTAQQPPAASDYSKQFKSDFDMWYGRRYYIAPIIALVVLTNVAAWWGNAALRDWVAGGQSIEILRGLVASALAGAFVWIIQDEIDRLRRRDFTSSDIYYYVFRLLLSVPFGWAITRLQVTQSVGVPLAFFLGAFPTTTLFTMARRIAVTLLKTGDDVTPQGKLELENLQCVGKDIAERFKDEGISTICQLAYADPVDLTIRTNFDFSYVADIVSQALLWIYLQNQISDVLVYSLRGAQEVASLMTDLAAGVASARTTIDEAAKKLGVSSPALQSMLDQVARDPYTQFLVKVWS